MIAEIEINSRIHELPINSNLLRSTNGFEFSLALIKIRRNYSTFSISKSTWTGYVFICTVDYCFFGSRTHKFTISFVRGRKEKLKFQFAFLFLIDGDSMLAVVKCLHVPVYSHERCDFVSCCCLLFLLNPIKHQKRSVPLRDKIKKNWKTPSSNCWFTFSHIFFVLLLLPFAIFNLTQTGKNFIMWWFFIRIFPFRALGTHTRPADERFWSEENSAAIYIFIFIHDPQHIRIPYSYYSAGKHNKLTIIHLTWLLSNATFNSPCLTFLFSLSVYRGCCHWDMERPTLPSTEHQNGEFWCLECDLLRFS